MKKSIIRIACFALLLVGILVYINQVFKVKFGDGIYDVTKFYQLDNNTVDVLILGSSHAFEDVNTGTLWDDYGMSSFVLGGSVQPMWNTYYYLKEALKTQTPELIVLEGYMLTWTEEYIDDSRIIKNNFGLKWSKDKVNSIKLSAPVKRWPEFFLEYVQYHTRYRDLSGEDFLENLGNPLYADWKGSGCNMATTPSESMDISNVSSRSALFEKTERYYREIIELAQSKGIPIVVVISPYARISPDEQSMYNQAADIASEYGVPFQNFNLKKDLDAMQIDFSIDAADTSHLNYKGSEKYTQYLGDWIKNNFSVSDRRGEKKYDTWKRNADYIRQMIYNHEIRENEDLNSIIPMLNNENYKIFLAIDGSGSTEDPETSWIFETLGITTDINQGIWCKSGVEGITWQSGYADAEIYIQTELHDLQISRQLNEDGGYTNSLIVDNVEYRKVDNGINILIYDEITQSVVDAIGFDKECGFKFVR